ncbi:MAG TPA: type II secretion system protein, partial [Acidobacteriaceae bacterium]|nr:type II secretion system protein [Acidobacteriaceae bacterium]
MRNAELGTGNRDTASTAHDAEQGFMLLGLIVAIAILLLFLGVAASDAAYSLRREKELESARRADQYWRAIRLFDLKFGRYPPSVEALENTNNVRYLRQRYVDPLTGQADYRMIVVGQNKTTVKGFFGEPLGGIALTAPGAMGGSPAPGSGGATYGGGVNGATGNAGAAGGTGANGPGGGAGGTMGSGTAGTSSSSSSSSGMSPMGSPIGGSGMGAVMGPIMGVGSSASGPSILTV